jgi:YD repeat-containing protein
MLTDMISSYGKVQFGYDTDNRLQGCLRGYREQNSNTDKWKVQTHYAYDSRNIGRLIAITNAGLDNNAVPNITVAPTAAAGTNGSIFDEFVYDDFGRLTSYNAIATSLNNSLKRTISFDYDSRGQLSTENHQKADATYWAKMVYNYDDTTGINLSKIDRQTPTDTAVIPGDQLTINSDNRITNNGYIFKDITGNPTKYNGNNMLYDADDRLIKVLSVSTLWAVLFNDIVKMSDHYVS